MTVPGYLLDENLIGGPLSQAILGHNALPDSDPLLVIGVGDANGPPRGIDDPALLRWAEAAGLILVSSDRQTLVGHFRTHLREGRHSPGLFLLPRRFSVPEVIESLVLAAYALSDPGEWRDRVVFLPFR
jgi:hypothetical protein